MPRALITAYSDPLIVFESQDREIRIFFIVGNIFISLLQTSYFYEKTFKFHPPGELEALLQENL